VRLEVIKNLFSFGWRLECTMPLYDREAMKPRISALLRYTSVELPTESNDSSEAQWSWKLSYIGRSMKRQTWDKFPLFGISYLSKTSFC